MDDEWYRDRELDELYTEASDDHDDDKNEVDQTTEVASRDASGLTPPTLSPDMQDGGQQCANVNIRGAGTSERSFYRRKLQKRNLEDDAAKSNSHESIASVFPRHILVIVEVQLMTRMIIRA